MSLDKIFAGCLAVMAIASPAVAVQIGADLPSSIRTVKPANLQQSSARAPMTATGAAAPSAASASVDRQPVRNDAASVKIPQAFEIKLVGIPEQHGGPGWLGSLVIGALTAALASVATTVIAANKKAALEQMLLDQRHAHERQSAEQKHGYEAMLRSMDYQQEGMVQKESLSREDQKIATERERLRMTSGLSAFEVEMAARRLVREQEAEFARLIHLFFEQLTSENEVHRAVALFAISEFDGTASLKELLAKKTATGTNMPPARAEGLSAPPEVQGTRVRPTRPGG